MELILYKYRYLDRHESEELEILPCGFYQLPFQFNIPVAQMPGSLETKAGSIRYHIKALIDIPYASKFLFINIFSFLTGSIYSMN